MTTDTQTITATQTVTITTRSRNLGYEWTSSPVQTRGGLRIDDPVDTTDMRVGLRGLRMESERAWKINSGNDWRAALYVGGRRVEAVKQYGCWDQNYRVSDVIWALEHGESVEVKIV